MTYVFYACAIICLLRNEAGANEVKAIPSDDSTTRLMHAINLREVYYDYHRAFGEAPADKCVSDLVSLGLVIVRDMDDGLLRDAGALKSRLRRISLADCFAVALARREKGELLTTDHREFDPIASADLCSIHFLR